MTNPSIISHISAKYLIEMNWRTILSETPDSVWCNNVTTLIWRNVIINNDVTCFTESCINSMSVKNCPCRQQLIFLNLVCFRVVIRTWFQKYFGQVLSKNFIPLKIIHKKNPTPNRTVGITVKASSSLPSILCSIVLGPIHSERQC